MKKILVTGASGNVGKYVTEALLQYDEKVVVAGTDIDKLQKMFGNQVETVYFDFTNQATFQAVLEDVDRVFLIRPPHLGKPTDLYPFIDAMKRYGIEMVSFLSLLGIEKNTMPPHHKIEKYIEASGIPFAHVRPSFFMQNISGIHALEIKEKNEIFIPAGRSQTSFIDAKDIGLAVATLLHEHEKYRNTAHTITGAEALNYDEVAKILSELTEKNIRYAKPGFLKYRRYYLKERKLAKTYVNVTVALYFMTRLGTAKKVTNDFFELTGKHPRSFKEFAKAHIEHFL